MGDNWRESTPGEDFKAVLNCDLCGEPIYEEQVFYRVDGVDICEDCMFEMKHFAHSDD